MPTVQERVGVLETKVHNIDEKIDDVKVDIKDLHDCLDQTRDRVLDQLGEMSKEYRTTAGKYHEHAEELNKQQSAQHQELAAKISELEKFKNKWMYMILGGVAVIGWVTGHIDTISKLLK
jgi:predicted RNase H-like nuclease (RuvC/YqgF family)